MKHEEFSKTVETLRSEWSRDKDEERSDIQHTIDDLLKLAEAGNSNLVKLEQKVAKSFEKLRSEIEAKTPKERVDDSVQIQGLKDIMAAI